VVFKRFRGWAVTFGNGFRFVLGGLVAVSLVRSGPQGKPENGAANEGHVCMIKYW